MEDDCVFLDTFRNEVLDDFLSRGWYRSLSVGCMFTEDTVVINGVTYPVYWIRYNVGSIVLSSSQKALPKLQNEVFYFNYFVFKAILYEQPNPENSQLHFWRFVSNSKKRLVLFCQTFLRHFTHIERSALSIFSAALLHGIVFKILI